MKNEHIHDEQCTHDVVILTDDEGNDQEFIIFDVLEVNNTQYALLIPHNEFATEGIIMRLEKDENDEEYLVDIEDENEWKDVLAAYEKYVAEVFGQ